MVGLGTRGSCCVSVRPINIRVGAHFIYMQYTDDVISQTRTCGSCLPVCPSNISIDHLSSSLRSRCGYSRPVCLKDFYLVFKLLSLYDIFFSIGNLLGEGNAVRAGVAAKAAMLVTLVIAWFTRLALV